MKEIDRWKARALEEGNIIVHCPGKDRLLLDKAPAAHQRPQLLRSDLDKQGTLARWREGEGKLADLVASRVLKSELDMQEISSPAN